MSSANPASAPSSEFARNAAGGAGLARELPETRWLSGADGRRLAFSAYPARDPRLHLLISHGFGEHRGWYDHVARAFGDLGISAYTFDHFHHGRSDGRPADAPRYEVLGEGLRLALEQGVAPLCPAGAPLALLGHSNGALAVLQALPSLAEVPLAALVLSNPLLGLPWRLGVWGRAMAWLLAHFAPKLMLPLANRPQWLTSDRKIWPAYRADPLRFRSVSVRFFLEMARAAGEARARKVCRVSPLLLLCSGRDRVVDSAATLNWFEALECPGKELIRYPGLRHEIFNEAAWRPAVEQIAAWLLEHCAPERDPSRRP